MMEPNKREIFVCDCHSLEHIFAIWYDSEDNTLYIEPHLNRRPFFERIKYAFNYILGNQSRFGAFDEIIVKPEDAEKIKEFLNKVKKD